MHRKHRESVMVSLERRAKKLNKALNALTDVSATAVEGSMSGSLPLAAACSSRCAAH